MGRARWIIRIGVGLFILAMVSCNTNRKDDPEPAENDTKQVPFTDAKLLVGEEADLTVIRQNRMIHGNNSNHEEYGVDVDQNGSVDFVLKSRYWGENLNIQVPVSEISSAHENAYLQAYTNEMSIYKKTKKVVKNKARVETTISHYYSCSQGPDFSLFSVERNTDARLVDAGEFVESQGDWMIARAEPLTFASYEYPEFKLLNTPDSLTIQKVFYELDCRGAKGAKVHYLGIRMTSSGAEKLGWIKIKITGNNQIMLMETALQR
ncbi:MAG: hypothetical protein MUF42_13830 [Cytophagaceae bacterium]|jgi:hypothetical protein|nr:hypothetical protein [Cytophagaceae bacterium]